MYARSNLKEDISTHQIYSEALEKYYIIAWKLKSEAVKGIKMAFYTEKFLFM